MELELEGSSCHAHKSGYAEASKCTRNEGGAMFYSCCGAKIDKSACPVDCTKPCCKDKKNCGVDCQKTCCKGKKACASNCQKACCKTACAKGKEACESHKKKCCAKSDTLSEYKSDSLKTIE